MDSINKNVTNFFSALSDETRLKILVGLMEEPQTVTEIHKQIGKDRLTLSAISHQLKHLADTDIVVYEKKGREKIFQLSNKFCWCILRDAFKHFKKKNNCKKCSKIKGKLKTR